MDKRERKNKHSMTIFDDSENKQNDDRTQMDGALPPRPAKPQAQGRGKPATPPLRGGDTNVPDSYKGEGGVLNSASNQTLPVAGFTTDAVASASPPFEGGVAPHRGDGVVSPSRKKKKTLVFGIGIGVVITFAVMVLVASFWNTGRSAAYTFLQTAWNTETGTTATHASNQTGWTEYSAKDSNVTAGTDITLATSSLTATDDGTLTTTGSATGGTFSAGTASSTTASGSGSSGTVTLTGSNSYPNEWDFPQLRPVPTAVRCYDTSDGECKGLMIRNGSDDEIYVLSGNNSTAFYKYSIANNTWTTLTVVPGSVGKAGMMIRNGSDNEIYVLRGGGNTSFYKYNISGNSWTILQSAPGSIGDGGMMIRNGGDNDIYVLQGSTGTGFYKYSVSGNSWTSLTVVPASTGAGAYMVRNAADNDIYVTRGGANTTFYSYSISGNSWTTLTAAPNGFHIGTSLIRNGASDDIYASAGITYSGGYVTRFYKYSIAGNSWTTLTQLPWICSSSWYLPSKIIRNGSDNDIYVAACKGIYKYSISGNSWTALSETIPQQFSYGVSIYRNGSDNDIYVLGAGNATNFYKYSISANSWASSRFGGTTYNMREGSMIVRNGNDDDMYVLIAANNYFYKYTISTDTWTLLSTNALAGALSAYMIRNGSDNDIYFFQGNGSTNFGKYNISGNSWSTLTAAPGGISYGGMMMRNASANDIYVLRGGGTTNLYKYSITDNTWVTLAVAPGAIGCTFVCRALMLRNGNDNDIYVLRGNNTTDFYKYSISGDSWTTLTAVPGAVDTGGMMIRNSSDDDIYVLRGNSQQSFYKYSISGDSWTTLTAVPGAIYKGGMMMRNGGDDDIYVLRGNTTTSFYKYSITGNSWTTLTATPGTAVTEGGYIMMNSSENRIYMMTGGNNDNQLFRYTIGKTYPSSGTFESATIDLATSPASFGNLTWTATVPAQTGANAFQVRVAGKDTNSGWVAGDYVGSDGTSSTYFTSSGTAIPSALNGKRYVRYKVFYATADTRYTPTLSDLTVAYTGYGNGTLTSNIYNAGNSANVIGKIAWTESGTSASETIKWQIRSSADGATWSNWCGYADTGSTCAGTNYFASANNNAFVASTHPLLSDSNDQYFQYKLFLASGGTATPTLNDVTVTYVINTAPAITNVTASQGSDGIVTVGYDLADGEESSVTTSLFFRPALVTLNEELTSDDTTAITVSNGTDFPDAGTILIDSEQITYTSKSGNNLQGTITRGVNSTTAVAHTTSTGIFIKASTTGGHTGAVAPVTGRSATWTAKTDYDGYYSNTVIKVLADDGMIANRFGSGSASSFNLDTKNPASVTFSVNAGKATANRADLVISATDDNSMTMNLSNDSAGAADGVNATSGTYVAYGTSATDWVLQTNPDTVYIRVKDAKGNTATAVSAVTPATPASVAITETSTGTPITYRLFISWEVIATPSDGFGSYKVYRKQTSGGTYSLIGTVTDINKNYYNDTTMSANVGYTYYVVGVSTNGNVSQRSSEVSGTANGQPDTDAQAPPVITAGPTATVDKTTVTITWTTDKASDSNVDYSTNTAFNITKGVPTVDTEHSVEISGLSATTAYKYRIRSKDATGNEVTDSNSGAGYTFTTGVAPSTGGNLGIILLEPDKTAPNILVFEVTEVSSTTAKINIRTDEQSTAEVSYGLEPGKLDITGAGSIKLNTAHSVTLLNLKPETTYFARAEVKDSGSNSRKSEVKQFKTTTEQETSDKKQETKNNRQETVDEQETKKESTTPLSPPKIGGESKDAISEIETKTVELKLEVPVTKTEIVDRLSQDFQEVIKNITLGTLKEDSSSLAQFISSASEELPAPQIVEGLPIVDITSTTATFEWKTDKPANSLVGIVPSGLYKPSAVEPYIIEVGNSRDLSTEHRVAVTELRPATSYHYQIRSQGSLGPVAKSRDYEFKTFSEKLDIIVAEVLEILPTRAKVYWRTTTDADSQVEYTPLNENGEPIIKEKGTQGKTDTSVEHTVEVQNLMPGRKYLLRVISRDKLGQTVDRYLQPITTSSDNQKPQVSQISSESTLYPGVTPKVQTLIVWKTNEQSNSQVMYWPGLKEPQKEEEKMRTQVSNEYTVNHVIVLTNLIPGNVYQYRVKSVDESGNATLSDAYTMLAPLNSESVIDVITKNFSDIFGWLRKR